VDAFAAAAAESLGWLIVWRFGSESAAAWSSQPGRLGSSPAEGPAAAFIQDAAQLAVWWWHRLGCRITGPADAACQAGLNVTLQFVCSRPCQPCHAV
jgi:hypothetical protein